MRSRKEYAIGVTVLPAVILNLTSHLILAFHSSTTISCVNWKNEE